MSETSVTAPIKTIVGPMVGSPTEQEVIDAGLGYNHRVCSYVTPLGYRSVEYKVIVTGPICEIYSFAKSYNRWRWQWEKEH